MLQDPSVQFLLWCLRDKSGDPCPVPVTGWGKSEWSALIRLAGRNGVGPLFYHRLASRKMALQIPDSIERILRTVYLRSSSRAISQSYDLARLLISLNEISVQVMTLKGAHLAGVVYERPALRPMSDIDLLVSGITPEQLVPQLEKLGYRVCEGYGIEALKTGKAEAIRLTTSRNVLFEIHWTVDLVNPPFLLRVEELWARAHGAVMAGVENYVLCPEHLLLHLCVHSTSHHFFNFGLRAFCDIAETLRRYGNQLDWDLICESARRGRMVNVVYLTLSLTRQLLNADVPETVLHELRPADFQQEFARQAIRMILESDLKSSPISSQFAQLSQPATLVSKAKHTLARIFLPRHVLSKLYALPPNSPRIYLYYLVRMKDLIARYGRIAFQLIRRNQHAGTLADQEIQRAATLRWLQSG